MDRFPYSSAPLRRVKAVQFGIIDPDFLVRCRAPAVVSSDWVPRCTCFSKLVNWAYGCLPHSVINEASSDWCRLVCLLYASVRTCFLCLLPSRVTAVLASSIRSIVISQRGLV